MTESKTDIIMSILGGVIRLPEKCSGKGDNSTRSSGLVNHFPSIAKK